MKLKNRLIISFCIIIFVPIILAGCMLYGLKMLQANSINNMYGVDGDYEYLANSLQLLSRYTTEEYQKIEDIVNTDPDQLADVTKMQKMNETLEEKYSFMIIRKNGVVIYNGAASADEIDLSTLPDYGDNQHMDNVVVYVDVDTPALLRQIDFSFSDGGTGSAFLVTTAGTVLPEVKKMLIDFLLSVVLILIFTATILITWTYGGLVPQVRQLVKAAESIKEGNLDFTIETKGKDEMSELCNAFEDMRQRLQKNAQEKLDAEAEQKSLISNIAHDLKTPITAIKGYSEGLMDGVADTPEKQQAYLKTIYNKTNEMNTLINELTLYSKIDTNKIPYNFQKLNMNAYFMDCVEELGMDLENQHVRLCYFNYVDNDVLVIADPEQLTRVIHNIIGNSIKYMGTGEGTINLRVKDVGDFVQVEIEDNGKGIAAQDLPYIFDRFYRADASRNSAAGGSGIGLSIVKKIIEDHGGKIWATSKEDVGTVMYLVLRKYQEVVNE